MYWFFLMFVITIMSIRAQSDSHYLKWCRYTILLMISQQLFGLSAVLIMISQQLSLSFCRSFLPLHFSLKTAYSFVAPCLFLLWTKLQLCQILKCYVNSVPAVRTETRTLNVAAHTAHTLLTHTVKNKLSKASCEFCLRFHIFYCISGLCSKTGLGWGPLV